MYCTSCGARVPEGRGGCDTCGAPVHRAVAYAPGSAAYAPAIPGAATCPRCGYHGPGQGHFNSAGPIAIAIILAMMTVPLMGAGGIFYYALRHDHRSCPRCGESWGKRGALALPFRAGERSAVQLAAETEAAVPPQTGVPWGVWVLFFLSGILGIIGLTEAEPLLVAMSAFAGVGGGMLVRTARRDREERRQALLVALQQPVLRLAGERGGRLTVTDVAAALSWPLPRAEKVLNSLEDGFRVASDVTERGVIVYEFRELLHAPQLSGPERDPFLRPPEARPGTDGHEETFPR